jgi:DTW domain-containing protein YfiP
MSLEPRATCLSCLRPESSCYCRHIRPVQTRTRVVILQHPRERDVAIGTARMASLCLPGSELHVGVDWSDSPALRRALSDPSRPAALLYPGPGAIDVREHPPKGPITLVVVDGTWWQAKALVRDNPVLSALPRYAFTPDVPSQYRIRREPAAAYVSTIEALVYVLGALEGDAARFHALLEPFRAMIDRQLQCEAEHRGQGSRHVRRRTRPRIPAPPAVPPQLRERAGDIVCVHGEANAWPYGTPQREGLGDELVHWVAERPATGEILDVVLAPRHPLATATPSHTRLSAEALAAGQSVEQLGQAWRGFVCETDIVCSWGHYATRLFEGMGLSIPERLDLRHAARVYAKGKVGTLEEFVTKLGAMPSSPAGAGRAHVRLAELSAIVRAFQAPSVARV